MKLQVKDGELHMSDSFAHKDELRSGGFRFDKKLKTWHAPACLSNLAFLRKKFPKTSVSDDQETSDWMAKSGQRAQQDAFITKYLQYLISGRIKPNLINVRLKEGIRPYMHQQVPLDFMKHTDVMALFWDCGLGKTFVVCSWIQFLKDTCGLKRALVVAPRATLHSTWMEDIQKFTWLKGVVLDEGSAGNKKTLAKSWARCPDKNQDFDVYAITYESLANIQEELSEMTWDFMAVDESTKIKNPTAKRSKAIVELADQIKRKVIMAGLPTPNGMEDIFMQLRVLSPDMFGTSHHRFLNENFTGFPIMVGDRSFTKWKPTSDGTARVQERMMRRGIRMRMEDAGLDLPGKVCIQREAYLPAESYARYVEMKKVCLTYLKNQPVFAEGISQIMKLREATSEFMLDASGSVLELSEKPSKISVLEEILEDEIGDDPDTGKPRQAVIWAHFAEEYKQIKKALGDKVVCTADHADIWKAIQMFKSGEVPYLLSNPSSMGHGVTLVQANNMVWYSYSHSSEQYYQACRRIERIGQVKTAVIYHIVAVGPNREKTIDGLLLQVVDGKLKNNENLMSVFKEGLE